MGGCYVQFDQLGLFSGLAEANCCNWRTVIKITATNGCGSTVIYKTLSPDQDTCDPTYLRFSQNPMKEGDPNNKITVYTGVNSPLNQDYTITIHTQYAEQVYSKTQKETEFNISHLKKGFYIARLQTSQGNIISEKFIIEE